MRTLAAAIALAALPLLAGTNNADSCDIGVTPAATLLLPYFEVETAGPVGSGMTTLFTVTNTSRYPQIAHVTVWTDWAYPVLNFNLFLSGYDVQSINLYDVIVRGLVLQSTVDPNSASFANPGAAPFGNMSNPNFVLTGDHSAVSTCASLPRQIQPDLRLAVQNALTTGSWANAACGNRQIGYNHGSVAEGYVTIDVVSYCTAQFPTDDGGSYFGGASGAILFDNVLLGDYQQLGPRKSVYGPMQPVDASGGPMVHIRALPEGGLSGAGAGGLVGTSLPFTFYDRYTPEGNRVADRRQPLPSIFTARFIQSNIAGFETDFKIWREGLTDGLPSCSPTAAPNKAVVNNSSIIMTAVVRFDEHENGYGIGAYFVSEFLPPLPSRSPAASRISALNDVFPELIGFDAGGWMYLNLSSASRYADYVHNSAGCARALSAQRPGFANGSTCATAAPGLSGSRATSQNWVISSMFGTYGAYRLGVDFDAAWLGNGCTPAETAHDDIAGKPTVLICPSGNPAGNCGAGTVFRPLNP